ncbi:hypothetical protein [Mucilaginibacter flavus]|uniref:hypothetical protein n=1 Tax=Mucilaginibacter flavus TaxID=931504 RepID=UPI0025B3DC80|nr:hypothetical protein [Mucilaginibacter flavus]MDN3584472.1 hypothetical protein [Mucilaginibacter flavus]
MIVIAAFNWLISSNYANINYSLLVLAGLAFWGLCILAVHQVKLAVDRNEPAVIHQTILAFFVINAVFSFGNLFLIFLETHAINPYTYQGQLQKYFIGTGDYVRGITFDISTTNALLNGFGVIYFLTRKNAPMLFVCMATLLLTGSNFLNLVVVSILLLLFAFKTNKYQKSLVVICLVFLAVFMAKISPQNNKYTSETIAHLFHKELYPNKPLPATNLLPLTYRPDSILNPEERRQKKAQIFIDSIYVVNHPKNLIINKATDIYKTESGHIEIKGDDINSAPFQSSTETPAEQKPLISFISLHKQELPISGTSNDVPEIPGKLMGFMQTATFLKQHLGKLATGAGMGNFSSKLAFRATGLGFAGGYPHKLVYINHSFLVNHLDLYLNFFSKRSGFHSLTNSPFSVYDQLLAEYGIIGLLVFAIYYLGFFTRHHKVLTYGLPILLLMLAAFFIEYWFEQLSVMIFFELLLLLDIKEHQTLKPLSNEF